VSEGVRVLLADDHAAVRAGVRMALESDGCEVCAETTNASDAVAAAIRTRPDVCLIDIKMPGDGIRAVGDIAAALPGTPIVMLTVSAATDDLIASLSAGAIGYLMKDMDPALLSGAVRAAAAGEAPMTGELTARLVEEFRRRGRRTRLVAGDGSTVELSRREWEVLELLAAGLSTAEIAGRLFIDRVTVRRHVSGLLKRLAVSSRGEAIELLGRPEPRPPRTTVDGA
jgi:DNA-binding NarL/FixJ family response regulator